MDPIFIILLDLRNSLVNTIVFTINNLIMYLMISGSFLFTSTRSTISLYHSFVYLRESPIWKGEVGTLFWLESLHNLFYGLNRGLSNVCETASLITSSSDSGVKYFGLNFLGSYFLNMEEKAKLNVESINIDPILLKNTEHLLYPVWIFNSGRQFYEWAIVFFYFPKYQVKI